MTATIDTSLVVLLVVIGWLFNGIALVIFGAAGVERERDYGEGSVIVGLAYVVLVLVVLLW